MNERTSSLTDSTGADIPIKLALQWQCHTNKRISTLRIKELSYELRGDIIVVSCSITFHKTNIIVGFIQTTKLTSHQHSHSPAGEPEQYRALLRGVVIPSSVYYVYFLTKVAQTALNIIVNTFYLQT